jgi:CRISPR-associated endonuclease/helicase Cas3
MKDFFSHPKKDETGRKNGGKKIVEHTFGVRDKALSHFYTGISFPQNTDGQAFLRDVCLFHDLGKYTSFFQRYLFDQLEEKLFDFKQHARFGAQAIGNYFRENPDMGYMAYFIVKNHHRNLHTPSAENQDGLLCVNKFEDVARIFEAQRLDVLSHLPQIETELGLENLSELLQLPIRKKFANFVADLVARRPDIHRYFFINYFFSLLIEADKLDASQTAPYIRQPILKDSVERFIAGRNANNNEHNQLRTAVRREVVGCLDEPGIEDFRLFMLTAPTGIGKTLTALDFAIRLRSRLAGEPQIVVGLPFINIIEQTLKEYQDALAGQSLEILGHYQYADVFGDRAEKESDEEKEGSYLEYNRRRMELETWQADIVVTSFVQLLQTMIANKNKMLLKFNHLAGAIVIMDEVQSLRLEQVPLIGTVLHFMAKFLGTRFVLMTATKPLIFELAEREVLKEILPNEQLLPVKHLLHDPEPIFRQFHRTQIVPTFDDSPLPDTAAFIDIFFKNWSSGKSCLVVCNTVQRSIEVFEELEKQFMLVGNKPPLFYLSTNVLPVHRMDIIRQIKERMKEGAILVATQVVEAGVDLDFDMGFRDLGPVDSIVQVAGRINRENSTERRNSPLYIVDFGDCHRVYGRIAAIQVRRALGQEPIFEPDYYRLVEKYFWAISDKNSYTESRKLFRGMLHLQYDEAVLTDTLPVSKFQVIEDSSQAVSVFVEWDETAAASRQAWQQMLDAPSREASWKLKAEFEQKHKRTFHQHIIAVPKYLVDLPPIDKKRPDMGIYLVLQSEIEKWYVPPTGFNRRRVKIEKTLYCMF